MVQNALCSLYRLFTDLIHRGWSQSFHFYRSNAFLKCVHCVLCCVWCCRRRRHCHRVTVKCRSMRWLTGKWFNLSPRMNSVLRSFTQSDVQHTALSCCHILTSFMQSIDETVFVTGWPMSNDTLSSLRFNLMRQWQSIPETILNWWFMDSATYRRRSAWLWVKLRQTGNSSGRLYAIISTILRCEKMQKIRKTKSIGSSICAKN